MRDGLFAHPSAAAAPDVYFHALIDAARVIRPWLDFALVARRE
jgi:hypothetical protein